MAATTTHATRAMAAMTTMRMRMRARAPRTARAPMGVASARRARDGRVRASGDGDATDDASGADAPSASPAKLSKGEYYAGFVNEPIQGVDTGERDVITPTIKLVTQSTVVLTMLYLGFTYSNNLPPFGPGPTMP
jgi:hypothetical protein